MKIVITKSKQEASLYVAEKLMNVLASKEHPTLGLATGGTPKGVYAELINAYTKNETSFHHAVTFNLDEYLGLDLNNKQGYAYYMQENLFKYVNFNPDNIHIPNGKASNPEKECQRYHELIKAHNDIDIQLLGIGTNGHIGFNEPSDQFYLATHITTLDEQTRKSNARYFDSLEAVPKRAITMGVGEIMDSREVVLLALGEAKQDIMEKLLNSKTVDPKLPASVLHLHRNLTVVMDEAAAKKYNKKVRT